MPYPRFTKAIIHHFMSQHKSISRRQGLPYHTVDNDGVLNRLKFINKGDIYQVYGKPIPDTLITNNIKIFKAYKTFFGISTGLIPPKKRRGKGAHETKAIVVPKEDNCYLQEEAVKVDRAIKARKRKSRLHDQSGGSSKGASLRLEAPDELTGKFVDSDEGFGTLPKVLDESKDKSVARDDLDDLGSTNDEEYLLAYKDEKLEDIPWQSTDDDEYENVNEEDDASIDIKKTDKERTDTNVEDQVKGVAEMNIAEEAEKENTGRVE
ncbi:hypothetical protein Tco_0269329 [Tanacetum coccineum]